MHIPELLHTYLEKSCPEIHKQRLSSLMRATKSLLNQGKLTLTSLGRHMTGSGFVKHKIKAIDRLLGNMTLQTEAIEIYRALACKAIGSLTKIHIIVDWSPCASHTHQLLRASLVFRDRSITLYEEVHLEAYLGHRKIHKQFLKQLKYIIPLHCVQVLVITDAGFRTDWFQQVLDIDWDFEGRVRANMKYSADNGLNWQACTSLYEIASNCASYINTVLLSKKNKLPCAMYLYQEDNTQQEITNTIILKGKMEIAHRKSHSDPWLLVTSLSHKKLKATKVVKNYKRRMKIEHEFRDTKDPKWGLGFNYTRTRNMHRLAILLLIGIVAMFMLWLIGLAAEHKKIHYSYQANTIKTHRVLSLIFLALQVLLHDSDAISIRDINIALLSAQTTEKLEFSV